MAEGRRMAASVNRVILLGQIGRDGVDVRFTDKGTALHQEGRR